MSHVQHDSHVTWLDHLHQVSDNNGLFEGPGRSIIKFKPHQHRAFYVIMMTCGSQVMMMETILQAAADKRPAPCGTHFNQ